jgi:hypothetical protein
MKASEFLTEKWSQKYKSSINCSHPKGFSQRAHCAGKKKHNESVEMEMVCEDCGMCETHGNLSEIKQRLDPKCWTGKKIGTPKTKIKGGIRVNNCVPAESVEEARAIIKPEDGIAALKKFSAYLKKNIVDLASMADFEAEHSKQPYVDERFEGFLSRADGTPVTPIFNLGGKLALVGPNKNYLNIPTEMYYSYRGFMYGGVLENELMKILGYNNKGVAESKELSEEFDLIENIIEGIAAQNGVDAEEVWADLESLTEDELYAFAVTSQLNEDWQKANKQDKTDGMSQKAVNAYRRENPGSKLKTAVTTKPSKLKKGSKASKRRKSYCSRSRGQMKMHNISCAKTPDKAICKARRRWNC